MANKMLIDATHPEETRVTVVRGNRVEEFDFESASRRPLRGNIYLAKVTRVEPSLQACFVDYGGNRHGFLAFSEIHPDYYQIPVADRQALIAEEERAARAADSDQDRRERRRQQPRRQQSKQAAPEESIAHVAAEDAAAADDAAEPGADDEANGVKAEEAPPQTVLDAAGTESPAEADKAQEATEREAPVEAADEKAASSGEAAAIASGQSEEGDDEDDEEDNDENGHEDEVVESVGAGDALEEAGERPQRPRRHYKIQEVIKRRQIMLVQVVKEERGTKGAAMTTYLSLAGRYSVLMPNTSRGGGISRKITDGADRKRLKELVADLEVPEGMGVILRTAGASRTKTEIKRDFEYLLRLWETVRELTLTSSAPALVYEEGSLTKRAIRDLYNKDIDEVLVAGDDGYKEAKDFMRMLMPSHAKNVKLYKDTQPLFTRYGVESQLDAMFSPVVQLKSGGYIVINPAEALVAIDVNSGRATREHHIEDTALKTNLEAAEEVARQLRLRDLAGLIVIDFIDMEQKRNNRAVERKLKDCLKHDRARIQVGRISHFGLMEMSRQRMRTGVLESSTVPCPHCGGTGHVRSVFSIALHLLRSLEEQLLKNAANDLIVRTRAEVALYLLNQKRAHLREIEQRFGVNILVQADAALIGQQYFTVDRGPAARGPATPAVAPQRVAPDSIAPDYADETENGDDDVEAKEESAEAHSTEEGGEPGRDRRRRRRRRGRGGGREGQEHAPRSEQQMRDHTVSRQADFAESEGDDEESGEADALALNDEGSLQDQPGDGNGQRRRRRRGRRGGRRNRRNGEQQETRADLPKGEAADISETAEGGDDEAYEAPDPFRSTIEPAPAPHEEPLAREEQDSEAPPPVAAPETPQPKRRRSTVRERFFGRSEPAPEAPVPYSGAAPAEPAPAERGGEAQIAPERPRRSGWWNRGR